MKSEDQEKVRSNFRNGLPPYQQSLDVIALDRSEDRDAKPSKREKFRLDRRIAYLDGDSGLLIVVPDDTQTFVTDLTSVPPLFTWLVPKTGAHLPAALIHDALVFDPVQETRNYLTLVEEADGFTDTGEVVSRVEADRIFRDGMRDTGTGIVRRWMVWAAVTLATLLKFQGSSHKALRIWYATIVFATLAGIFVLGVIATADLSDPDPERWYWSTNLDLPWMGDDRSFWAELVNGAAMAVVIPVAAGLAWLRFFRAGWIAGVCMALLLHVTVALVLLSGTYWLLERICSWKAGRWTLLVAAGLAVAASAFVFVDLWEPWK